MVDKKKLPDQLSLLQVACLLCGQAPDGEIASDLEQEMLNALITAANPINGIEGIDLIVWFEGRSNREWDYDFIINKYPRTLGNYDPNFVKIVNKFMVNQKDFLDFIKRESEIYTPVIDQYKKYPFWDMQSRKPQKIQKTSKIERIEKFSNLEGLKWQEVEIAVILVDSIRITARGQSEKFHYADLGFYDKRNGGSTTRWKVLCEFIKLGRVDSREIGGELDKIKKTLSDIRIPLKTLMHITEDPIPFTRNEGWEPAFKSKYELGD